MKPFLKYRGGKTTEIKHFAKYFPETFHTYLEPFVGAGAVYFHLAHRPSIINDINPRLMMLYRQIKLDYPLLRQQLDELEALYLKNQLEYENHKNKSKSFAVNKNETLYYELRQAFNEPKGNWLEGAVYFFINKTAYSGMIRYNKKGHYNVPFGRYKYFNTRKISVQHHQLLKQTDIFNSDYLKIFQMAGEKDFMFLDPPYDCTFNDYGNPQYENGGFDEAEHVRLAEAFKHLPCKALMIIGKTLLTEHLYQPFIVDQYEKKYAVNIRNRFKNQAVHLIVKNY